MSRICVQVTRSFKVSGVTDLDQHTDLVFEELLKLENERLTDSDLSAVLARNEVTISVIGIASNFDEALALADSAIRSAIHAAHAATPDWEISAQEQREWPLYETVAQKSDLVAA